MRRVDCRDCGVKVEALPWANGKHTLTRAYMLFLAQWARKLSWKETARSFRTSWEKVFNAVEWVVEWGLTHRELGTIRALGVDEIQYGRGHKYLTLVYQIEAGCVRLLWIGQERTKQSFARFFAMIGTQLCEKVEFVCSDMWKPYLEMIALHCPNALNILDRFHIVAKMNKAIDEVRADETRRMSREGYEPVLKKSRWCLLKRRENLTDKQRLRMRDLLQYNLRTVRAWLFKEEFQQLWDYISPVWAGKFLDQWCTEVMRSRIEPMKNSPRVTALRRAFEDRPEIHQAGQRALRHPRPDHGCGQADGGRGPQDHQAEHRQPRRVRLRCARRDPAGHDPQPAELGGLFGQQGHLRRAQGGDARDAEAGHRGRHARRHLPGQRRQRADRAWPPTRC